MIKITVVVPAYNAELYLREALESALTQSYHAHEIIVVNDGSNDGTDEIARSYGDRIHYIAQENQGVSAARNTAIGAASGDWVAFLDADDVMAPDKLAKQVKLIESDPELVVTYTGFTLLHDNGELEPRKAFPAKDLWPALRYRSPILPSTSLVKRDALMCAGCFGNTSAAEDWDLFFRLIRLYPLAAFQDIPESLLLYRQREDSLSKGFIATSLVKFNLLDHRLLEGINGVPKLLWKRKIEARFFHDLALSFRSAHDPRYWEFALESMIRWPLWGRVVPWSRYRVVANMLFVRLKHFQFNRRYWWPIRRCNELVGRT